MQKAIPSSLHAAARCISKHGGCPDYREERSKRHRDKHREIVSRPGDTATGHSARDVYRWLAANRIEIECKGIARAFVWNTSCRIDRPHTVSQPGVGVANTSRPPNTASSVRWTDEGVQLLHAPRLYSSRSQRTATNRGKRHESQQSGLALEQLRYGGGNCVRKTGR